MIFEKIRKDEFIWKNSTNITYFKRLFKRWYFYNNNYNMVNINVNIEE